MSTATSHKATLSFTDGTPTVEFPLLKGTVGPDVIDIRKLYGSTGKFTYDPGFLSTASCQSSITYIDGDKGELLYRGYPIEQLATNCDFLEVCYLIMNGELPNVAQRDDFNQRVISHTMVNEQMQFFLRGFRRDAHPMAVMTGLVGAMSAFYHDALDVTDPHHRISRLGLRGGGEAGCQQRGSSHRAQNKTLSHVFSIESVTFFRACHGCATWPVLAPPTD